MSKRVTAEYPNRQEAEAARARLQALGVPAGAIAVTREGQEAAEPEGIFDRLAGFLAPHSASGPGPYLLEADVSSDQLSRATQILSPGRAATDASLLEERVVEVAEMSEQLFVTKEIVVTEEVVLTRRVHERVADVNETVRRTEIEVERLPPGEPQERNPGA